MPKVGMEQKRRAEVINATLLCMVLHGMEGVTLERVADKAGCSKGVVAYYFKNKSNLIVASFRAFLSYYGKKIGHDIQPGMTAADSLEITLYHSLPPEGGHSEIDHEKLNVSDLDGVAAMNLSPDHKARLFLQFFSKAASDPALQQVLAEIYQTDMEGIARIFEYGKASEQIKTANADAAAYGMLAMIVGLSFFRVAGIQAPNHEDNRQIAQDYIERLKRE